MRTTLFMLAAICCAQAQPQADRIEWNHTPEALAGRFVTVRLTDGTRIRGSWLSVTPDAFTMNVEKTSNKQQVSKGRSTVPRSSIAELRAGKHRVRGRVIGTLAGLYGVAAIGGAVSGREALQGPFGIAALGGAIAGYFIGATWDHATREIVLLN